MIISELQIILRNKTWLIVLGLIAVLGALVPFRTLAGPAILLVLLFPLTDASQRWQAKSTVDLLNTLGTSRLKRTGLLFAACVGLSAVVLTPALMRMFITEEFQWLWHIGAIIFLAPVLIIATGTLTRSAVTGRLIMLIIWYVYLSSAS